MSKGGWAISGQLLGTIAMNLSEGSTILEIGSGYGTKGLLAAGYKVMSVEQNEVWVGAFHDNYCHAPLKDGWYDFDVLNEFLEGKDYDAILIDGPAGGDRRKVLESSLDFSKLIIVDDTERPEDRAVFEILREGRRYEDPEEYGVIFND